MISDVRMNDIIASLMARGWTPGGGGSGTVSKVSVATANGFGGTVATDTTTPVITLTTNLTGLLKGNGSGLAVASPGVDYAAGTSALATGILKSTNGTGVLSIAVAGDFPALPYDASGTASSAVAAHVAAPDPHPQYALDTDLSGYVPVTRTVAGHALSANVTLSAADVGLGSVTNDTQTKASVVPNTAPGAGNLLVGNAGGTAYAPVALSGDVTLTSSGAATVGKVNGVSFAGLATGLLKNTTGTGLPSIAVAGTDYQAPPAVSATVTAGTNAQGQGPLTSDINIVTTAASAPSGVTLPASPTPGKRILIVNQASNIVAVFPAVGGAIDAATVNNPVLLAANAQLEFIAATTAQWYSTQNTSYILPWGVRYYKQSGPTSVSATGTLSNGQISIGIIQYTGAAGTLTWPTAANLDLVPGNDFPINMAFEVVIINTGSGTATMATNTGLTLVGSSSVPAGTSARFRFRKTSGVPLYTVYRMS